MTSPIQTYRVIVPGYDASILPARSEEEACRRVIENHREAMEGLGILDMVESDMRVELATLPDDAGYDYVARTYGVDLEAGQRVRINIDGHSDAREGWVVYPGRGTAYAHVWFDGYDHPRRVHPKEIEILPSAEMKP